MPPAGRLYAPIDVNWYEEWGHEVSPEAALVWVLACCRSKQLMTDGRLTFAQLERIAPANRCDIGAIRTELCAIGAMALEGDSAIRLTGWDRWNPSAAAISQKADDKVKAAAVGNHRRWHEARGVVDPKCPLCDTDRIASAIPTESQVRIHKDRVETETNREGARKRATPAPDSFDWTAERVEHWDVTQAALTLGIDLGRETAQFLDHHRAKGSSFRDWDAAWRTWIANAVKFAERDGVQPISPTGGPAGRNAVDPRIRNAESNLAAMRRSADADPDEIALLEKNLEALRSERNSRAS